MKQTCLMVLFLCINFFANAQDVKVKISNIKVIMAKTDTLKTVDKNVFLTNKGGFQEVEIFNERNVWIKAAYKIRTNNGVRRSNLKKSAVDVDIVYTFIYEGKKNKIKVRRTFYLDDEKTFEESQTALFKSGINNKLFTLKYVGEIN